jgi:hypothetical protein
METNKPTEHAGTSQARQRAGRNPADNLTQEDRVRGGQRSASTQVRGPKGQFAGSVRRMGGDARSNGNSRSDLDQNAQQANGSGVGQSHHQ